MLQNDPRTRAYVEKRQAEGHTLKEMRRSIKQTLSRTTHLPSIQRGPTCHSSGLTSIEGSSWSIAPIRRPKGPGSPRVLNGSATPSRVVVVQRPSPQRRVALPCHHATAICCLLTVSKSRNWWSRDTPDPRLPEGSAVTGQPSLVNFVDGRGSQNATMRTCAHTYATNSTPAIAMTASIWPGKPSSMLMCARPALISRTG